MTDPLPDETPLPHSRPVLDPLRYLDEAMARLRRTCERLKATEVLADLRAKGVTLSVRDGQLHAGPPRLLVNGTAEAITKWKSWFVELIQETNMKGGEQ